jgi:hypothetical protein
VLLSCMSFAVGSTAPKAAVALTAGEKLSTST